jgi:hypothetical protein
MCRDVYHCDPLTFDKIPVYRTMQDLEMLDAETKVANLRKKR